MNNMFANTEAVKGDVEEDRVGGGGGPLSTDIYPGKIKGVYCGKAENSQSRSVTVMVDVMVAGKAVPKTFTEWVTNREGKATYTKDGQTHNLPGYNRINALCMLLTGKDITEMEVEERVLAIYDFDQSKDVNKSVPCFADLHGEEIQMAIQEVIEFKQKKNESTNQYEDTDETRSINNVVKFMPAEKPVTLSELKQYAENLGADWDEVLSEYQIPNVVGKYPEEDCAYSTKWLEVNRGQPWDKTKGKGGKSGGGEGRDFKKSGGGSNKGGEKKKSLFDD